jgi:hypothetical protein
MVPSINKPPLTGAPTESPTHEPGYRSDDATTVKSVLRWIIVQINDYDDAIKRCLLGVCECNEGNNEMNCNQHNTTQHNTTQHNTTQHNTTQRARTLYGRAISFSIRFEWYVTIVRRIVSNHARCSGCAGSAMNVNVVLRSFICSASLPSTVTELMRAYSKS